MSNRIRLKQLDQNEISGFITGVNLGTVIPSINALSGYVVSTSSTIFKITGSANLTGTSIISGIGGAQVLLSGNYILISGGSSSAGSSLDTGVADSRYVNVTGNENISGIKTFFNPFNTDTINNTGNSNSVWVSDAVLSGRWVTSGDPISPVGLATKNYVDNISGAINTKIINSGNSSVSHTNLRLNNFVSTTGNEVIYGNKVFSNFLGLVAFSGAQPGLDFVSTGAGSELSRFAISNRNSGDFGLDGSLSFLRWDGFQYQHSLVFQRTGGWNFLDRAKFNGLPYLESGNVTVVNTSSQQNISGYKTFISDSGILFGNSTAYPFNGTVTVSGNDGALRMLPRSSHDGVQINFYGLNKNVHWQLGNLNAGSGFNILDNQANTKVRLEQTTTGINTLSGNWNVQSLTVNNTGIVLNSGNQTIAGDLIVTGSFYCNSFSTTSNVLLSYDVATQNPSSNILSLPQNANVVYSQGMITGVVSGTIGTEYTIVGTGTGVALVHNAVQVYCPNGQNVFVSGNYVRKFYCLDYNQISVFS